MSEVIACRAIRRGRVWVAHVPEHGVYGVGHTLKAARASVERGLALLGMSAEVVVTPTAPELETLRSAEDAYAAALSAAVSALSLRRATLSDISTATKVPIRRVKALLAERTKDSPPPVDAAAGDTR
ncbi:hypothetical protein ACQEVS_10260 [Streptomyces sp. CA-181903]|uniref:hypothetical protein n=1 Tax=Streptomyces sp. CA-181903 TaxID=3240055 RepID=UPI003D8A1B6C